MSLQAVLRLLPNLTSDELAQVRLALAALGTVGPAYVKPGIRAEDDAGWVLSALMDVFDDQPVPVVMLRRSRQYPTFIKKLPDVLAWVRSVCPRRIEQQALLTTAFRLMRADIASQGNVTVTPAVLMSSIHMVRPTLDRHFPGYADAGFMSLVIRG